MRAVRVHEWTEFEALRLEQDVPPEPVGRGQLRVSIKASAISIALQLFVSGRYQRRPPLPFTPGSEIAGVVSEVGPGVQHLMEGDRVAGPIDWGGLADEAVASAVTLYRIPDDMGFAQAASLSPSYATSLAALAWPHLLDLTPGKTLLVHGASGGIGVAATEIGKILGATVIATAGGRAKCDFAAEHGADHVIDHSDQAFHQTVLDLTGGAGADAVLDPVGGDVFTQSLRCLAPEGRICPIGFASGEVPRVPANILLVKNLSVVGLNYGYYVGWSPDDVRESYRDRLTRDIDRLAAWFQDGRISLATSHALPLADFQEAMRIVVARESMGRVVVVP